MNLPQAILKLRTLLLLVGSVVIMGFSGSAAGTDQTITFPAISDKTYGDPSFGVHAEASSGLTVNFSILSGPATIAGTNVTITGTGTVAVVASQVGGGGWNPAAAINVFQVAPAVLTVMADDKFRTYGTTNPPFSYSVSGFVNGENDSVVSGAPSLATAATADSPIGSYDIVTAPGTLSATNYIFDLVDGRLSISKASLTVAADPLSKSYGASDPALTYQLTSGSLFGSDTFTGSITRAPGENAGTYAITQGTLTAGGNYTLTFAGTNLTITPITLVIAADEQIKVYGTADPALTYNLLSGALVGADALSGSLTRTAGENVGNHAIAQGTLTAGGNYAITFFPANLAITPVSLSVAVNDTSRRYGVTNPVFTHTINGFVNGDTISVVSGAPAITTDATSTSPVGTYTSVATLGTLHATNYTFDFIDGKLSVMPARLTIAADSQSKCYGDADPALTYQVTSGGLFGTDTLTGNLSRNPGENAGTYAITQGTLSAGPNYTLTFVGTNLTINRIFLNVAAESKARVYGTTNPPLTYTIAGFVNGEDESVVTGAPALSTAAAPQSSVGDYLIDIALGSLAATNYTFVFYDGALSVMPVVLTVTADARNKTYGAADPALTYQITTGALVGTDAITGSLTRALGENVGSYPISQGSLDAGGNYDITFVGTNLVISSASLTVAADVKGKIYGTADPGLTYHVASGALVGSDVFTGALTRAVGENIGTYSIGVGTLTAGNNYSLTFIGTNLTITPAALTVAVDAKAKIYGAADPSLTYQITSGALVGTDALTGSLVRVVGENVGTYAISQGTLTAGTNYNLAFSPTNLTISPASLSGSVLSSRNSSRPGSNVTFTVLLTAVAPGAGLPTGTVQFIVDNAPFGSPVALSSGAASISTAALTHGSHTVTTAYIGDGNFLGSTNSLIPNQLINWVPVAGTDVVVTRQNTPLSSGPSTLLANDSDGDLDPLNVVSVSATSLQGGTASLGGGQWTYTPPVNFTGTDAFAYTVADTLGETATGFVLVTVNASTNPPPRVVSLEPLVDGTKRLTFSGTVGSSYIVQASTNLTSWSPVSTNICASDGRFLCTDSSATNYPVRFYRCVSQ